jgi:threonine dehydrogenase-like Zn-dependent dehydrogenase
VHVDDLVPKSTHDVVVDCTGAPDGMRLAMQLCRPRGTIVLKSTYAHPEVIDLAPIVINELHVVGNRCGPFPEALEFLRSGQVHVEDMVSRTFPLHRGADAFAAAKRPDHLKVLVRPGAGA